MSKKSANQQTIANFFGPEFYNFVRGRQRTRNSRLWTLIASVVAIDNGDVVLPGNRKIRDIQVRVWNRSKINADFLPYKKSTRENFEKFAAAFNTDIQDLFTMFQSEFMEFILGDPSLMRREDLSPRIRQILRGVDFYLTILQDSLRY